MLFHIVFLGIDCLIRRVTQGTAHPYTVVIPHVTPDLPYDHWHGVGTEFHIQFRIEIIDCFDKPDAADLEQVVRIFIACPESLDDAQNEP